MIASAKRDKTLTGKNLLLVYCKDGPGVLLAHAKVEKNNVKNFDFDILLSSATPISNEKRP